MDGSQKNQRRIWSSLVCRIVWKVSVCRLYYYSPRPIMTPMFWRTGFSDASLCSTREKKFGFQRLGGAEDALSRAQLRNYHANMLPTAFHEQFRDGITLCTLDSVYQAFSFRDRVWNWQRMRRYVYVIVGKSSHVADENLFHTLNCIEYSTYSPYSHFRVSNYLGYSWIFETA